MIRRTTQVQFHPGRTLGQDRSEVGQLLPGLLELSLKVLKLPDQYQPLAPCPTQLGPYLIEDIRLLVSFVN